jgi:predicted permease
MRAAEQRANGVWSQLADTLSEIRQTLRALLTVPAFTLTSVGTLGLAIGVNAAIFTLVDSVLLDPLPYPDADRLIVIKGDAPGTRVGENFNLAPEFFIEYQKEANLLESVASFNLNTYTLRANERAERIWMSNVSLSFFETLGVMPQLGRVPTAEDGPQVAVISHRLWQEWFGGDPDVIGRSYFAGGAMRTVVGVMPRGFELPSEDVLLWFPHGFDAPGAQVAPGQFGLRVIARMRPGIEQEALIAQLALIAKRLPGQYGGPSTYTEIIERFTPRVVPLKDEWLGSLSGPLWILLGAMSILLAIACANVANLFLVRAERQRRDVAIRRAIGASRPALIRRQLLETTIVAILAGALAVGVAAVMVPLIVAQGPLLAQGPLPLPRLSSVQLTGTTILFTFTISLAAGLACGVMPAARAAGVDLAWLRDAARGATRGRHLTRDALVATQTALALLLLVGSGLLLRSFAELRNVDPGYDVKNIFTFQMAPQQAQLTDGRSWSTFHHAFMERLRGLPSVEKVGIVEASL